MTDANTKKVAICLFSYRGAKTDTLMAIVNKMIPYAENKGIQCGLFVYGNALIHRSRNDALAAAMRSDCTHVLFVDDDMLPQEEAVYRLLRKEKPVISALCTTRSHGDVKIAAKVYNPETDQFGWIDQIRTDKVITGPFAPGTGFLMVDRATVEALVEYHLSGRDWLDEHTKMLDRLRVKPEYRDAERRRLENIRRGRWNQHGTARVFDFPVNDDDEQLGEDICFGRKVLKLGIESSIDGTAIVGHIGDYPFTIYDVQEAS